MIINIETIEHEDQRYPTVGDWQFNPDSNEIAITVSSMGNPDFEFLVAVHELIESYLCRKRGISEEVVTEFDVWYERNRLDGDSDSEPGDHPDAPYQKEHKFATSIEKKIAKELEVDWEEYEKAVQSL